jgi:hypothetical protein
MHAGRVSILIPCFNYGRYLNACIESLFAQSYRDWEAIIVDDGSSDNTAEVAGALAAQNPARLRFIQTANRGVAAARNAALDQAQGEYVLALDADDLLPCGALEALVQSLKANPQAGFAYGCVENFEILPGQERFWYPGPFNRRVFLRENLAVCSSLWRRSFAQAGVRYRPFIFEDWDLFLQIIAKGAEGLYVPEAILRYRQQAASRHHTNRYYQLPGYLEVVRGNPSLYTPELVSFAEQALFNAPGCYARPTVVFLPAPDSPEYHNFCGECSRLAQAFVREGCLVAVIGGYEGMCCAAAGLMLIPEGASLGLVKLAQLGPNLLLVSARGRALDEEYRALENVALVREQAQLNLTAPELLAQAQAAAQAKQLLHLKQPGPQPPGRSRDYPMLRYVAAFNQQRFRAFVQNLRLIYPNIDLVVCTAPGLISTLEGLGRECGFKLMACDSWADCAPAVNSDWVFITSEDLLLGPQILGRADRYVSAMGSEQIYGIQALRLLPGYGYHGIRSSLDFVEYGQRAYLSLQLESSLYLLHKEALKSACGEGFPAPAKFISKLLRHRGPIWLAPGDVFSLWQLGESAQAAQYENLILAQYPDMKGVYKALLQCGQTLLDQKQASAARKAYEDALYIEAQDVQPKLGLACSYLALGKIALAGHFACAVLAKDAANTGAKNILKEIEAMIAGFNT